MDGPLWCIVYRWNAETQRYTYEDMTEDCIPVAVTQGWRVLAKDSDLHPDPIVPAQSNPIRTETDE